MEAKGFLKPHNFHYAKPVINNYFSINIIQRFSLSKIRSINNYNKIFVLLHWGTLPTRRIAVFESRCL